MKTLFEDFTLSILKLNRLVQKIKTHEIEKYGLKPVHAMCFYFLRKMPQELTAKKLSDLCLEDKAAISRALNLMQVKGYVRYDTNKRNAIVELTDDGKQMAQVIYERIENAVVAGSVDFTDTERVFFYKSLDAIVKNLTEYYREIVKNND